MLHGFCTILYQTRCSYICVCWPTLVLWSFDKKHASQFLCCAISVLCSSHVVDSNDGTITVAVMAGYTILNTFISKDPAFTCSNGSFLAVSAEDIIIIIFKQSFYTAVPRYYGSPPAFTGYFSGAPTFFHSKVAASIWRLFFRTTDRAKWSQVSRGNTIWSHC